MRASEQVMKEGRGIVGRAELTQQKHSHTHAHAHVSLQGQMVPSPSRPLDPVQDLLCMTLVSSEEQRKTAVVKVADQTVPDVERVAKHGFRRQKHIKTLGPDTVG